MDTMRMSFPFEVSFEDVAADIDRYVSAIFSSLESEFLVMPKGQGYVEYSVFESGYEALKRATAGFSELTTENVLRATTENVLRALIENPVVLIIVRTILGFTPPEWAYITTQRTGVEITQGFVRTLDRRIRMNQSKPLHIASTTMDRVKALIDTACALVLERPPELDEGKIHRLDKADTKTGLDGLRNLASMGVPYAMVLYERFLGRPFAGHRDSVSELIGDSLESKIEDVLTAAGVSYRKTKRAERLAGFDQAPDFIIPSEFNARVVIEAKITEDDGTARDKVTRVQHLAELSERAQPQFEVIACIGGRGFGVRREDMRKLLRATKGKVFTPSTLDRLVEHSLVRDFRAK